ncbi:UNKNOWN [Stylonychia lemnae]|uniref:Uncharacterized protein n=1 Tax=Stylonychia lemnae TaxID=5949 RepID=A0A077ZZR7_STYLE|nr:UNKNOWN [Stylonychia lemnae]|eukprot:CDW74708.1 UNKNOWN [Stylonychia lemnae]
MRTYQSYQFFPRKSGIKYFSVWDPFILENYQQPIPIKKILKAGEECKYKKSLTIYAQKYGIKEHQRYIRLAENQSLILSIIQNVTYIKNLQLDIVKKAASIIANERLQSERLDYRQMKKQILIKNEIQVTKHLIKSMQEQIEYNHQQELIMNAKIQDKKIYKIDICMKVDAFSEKDLKYLIEMHQKVSWQSDIYHIYKLQVLFKQQDFGSTYQQYTVVAFKHPLYLENDKINQFRSRNNISQRKSDLIMKEMVPEFSLINCMNASNINYILLNSFQNVVEGTLKVKLLGEIEQEEENDDF